MVYHPRSVRILGVAQLVIGTGMFLFGILNIAIVPYWSSYIGCGLWVGLWVGLTGLFGYLGARSNSDPNKCLIGTMIGFAVTSCVLTGVMLIIYAIALSEFARRLRCPQDVYPTRRYWDYSYSECEIYNRHYFPSDYISYSKAQEGAGLGSALLILAVVEFFVALASSIYGCNACCCTGTPGQIQPPVTYYQQPGGVIVTNPTGGAVVPGPAVQNVTTYPGVIQPQQGYIVAPQGYPVQQYSAGVLAAGGATAGTQQSQQPRQGFQNKQVEMPPPYNTAAQ